MKIQAIECKKIELPRVSKLLRTIDEEFAAILAQSIAAQGMFQPIVVRQDPVRPDRFLVVQGLHRWYAKKNILKEKFIDCIVLPKMEDAAYELAMIAGNLRQQPQTDGRRTLAVKRWAEFLESEPSGRLGRRSTTAEEARGKGPVDRLAVAFGVKKRQAERYLRAAKAFNRKQLEALDKCQVTAQHREEILQKTEKADWDRVIELISSGKKPTDAITRFQKGLKSQHRKKAAT